MRQSKLKLWVTLAVPIILVLIVIRVGFSIVNEGGDTVPTTPQVVEEKGPRDSSGVPASGPQVDEKRELLGDHHSHDNHVSASREFVWDINLNTMGEAFLEGSEVRFTLETFEGESLEISMQRYEPHRLGGGAMSGSVEGRQGSIVSLAQVGSAKAGSIHLPMENRVLEIRPGASGGSTLISEVDVEALGECQTCIDAGMAAQLTAPVSHSFTDPTP